VASAVLGETRLVRVYVPDRPRDLLLLNDGQNVFTRPLTVGSAVKWRADEAAAAVAPRLAIVAIDHTGRSRARDYLLYPNRIDRLARRPRGERYVAFVVDELLAWIARAYPALATPRHLGIGGSSYGAVSALATAMLRPGTFDRLLVESPALYVADRRILDDATRVAAWPERIAIGCGTAESRSPDESRRVLDDALALAVTFRSKGLGDDRLRVRVDDGARHHESAWAGRLPATLSFLFG
jgi:predicted alpha/beta superfamily hydrolase